MSLLRAQELCVGHKGRLIVESLSFEVRSGEVVGLLGPNGAGKTTTFRALTGLIPVQSGHVFLRDEAVTGPIHRRVQQGLGYLPQTSSLIEGLSVLQQVHVALEARGEKTSAALSFLEQVGVSALADRKIDGLSGGERRRVELARTLATDPSVLLLDEPFAGLAPKAISSLSTEIRRLASTGIGILLTDHAVRETMPLCDRVVLLDMGRLVLQGTPAEVAAHPAAKDRWLGHDWSL